MTRPLKPDQILTPLGIGLTLSLLGDSTLYTVLPSPDIASQVGLSLGMVGFLLGINRLVRLLFNSIAGWIYDRLPRRPLMLISLATATLSTTFYAFGSGPFVLTIGRILWGISWAGMWIGANSIALDISNDLNRGSINGKLQMWYFIGIAISSFCGGLFTDLFAFRGGMWVSAFFAACGWLIWLRFLPETRYLKERTVDPSLKEESNQKTNFPWKLTIVCGIPFFIIRVVFIGILGATTILWLSQFMADGSLLLDDTILPLATLSGTFIAVRLIISVLSAPPVGWVSDKLNRRWAVLVVLFLLFGSGGFIILASQNIWVSILGVITSAIAGGSIPGIITAIIGDQIPQDHQSRVLGFVFSFGDLGSAIGPALALSLMGVISLPALFLGCALLLALTGGLLLIPALFEHRKTILNEKRLA